MITREFLQKIQQEIKTPPFVTDEVLETGDYQGYIQAYTKKIIKLWKNSGWEEGDDIIVCAQERFKKPKFLSIDGVKVCISGQVNDWIKDKTRNELVVVLKTQNITSHNGDCWLTGLAFDKKITRTQFETCWVLFMADAVELCAAIELAKRV